MKKFLTSAGIVAALILGSAVPATADEDQPAVLDDIVRDTAPAAPSGDDLVARVGDVTAVLPGDLDDPVTLTSQSGATVSLTLPTEASVIATDREGAGAVGHDLDNGSRIVPALRSNGLLQVLSVLESERAPTSFTYGVETGAASSLVAVEDGGVRLLDAAGQDVAAIAPPWAIDDAGNAVPTRYEIDGNLLIQVVDTSIPGIVYPVVADPGVSVTYTQYRLTEVSKTYNWTNRAEQIGLCKIERGGGGGQCTISASRQVQTSIGVSLGATVSDVATGLNFSASDTRTVSVSWTSPPSRVGSSYKAWATGTRATYRVQRWVGHRVLGQSATQWRLVETSGTLAAFAPNQGFAIGQ